MKKKILVYRNHLIRPSETFIQSQVESLKNFDAFYVGLCTVAGIEVPLERTLTVCQQYPSQTRRTLVYKLCGRHSSFFEKIEKISPSLMHAHFGPDGVKALPLATRLSIPLIVTFHGYDITIKPSRAWYSSYSYFMYLARRKKLRRVASKFVAVSSFIKEKLIQRGFPEDKIVVHYVGVDLEKFSCISSQSRKPIVLFVGRLVEVKGCEFLIRAMAIVQSVMPNAELVVLGDGPLKKSLEATTGRLLTNYQFLGFQSQPVVKDWMQRAKVFSVPSISTKSGYTEAFGTVFVEAQSMGLPVVSSLSGGIPEAVEDGKTGFLVPEKDVQSLANRILTLLEDEPLWYQMSQNAIARARSHFDIRKQTKKLEDIYSEVLLKRQ